MKYGNLEYVHKSILDENDNILVSEELKIFSLQKIRPDGCVCVEGKRLVEKILCTERILHEKVIALLLLGNKGMDQRQWVDTTIKDILKSAPYESFLRATALCEDQQNYHVNK